MARQTAKTTSAVATAEPTQGKNVSAYREIMEQLGSKLDRFREMLPRHISVDQFSRVIQLAIQREPALLKADRRSFWLACMEAANDGLLPDGNEGAIVPFKNTQGGTLEANWLPMIAGVRKVARNSGDIADMDVEVVFATDQFEHVGGDDPRIIHKRPPVVPEGGRGPVIAAYSIVKLKDGTISREVMYRDQIDRVRAMAKTDKVWSQHFDEMAKKTVVHRHCKRLPKSRDLDAVLRKDHVLYNIEAPDAAKVEPRKASASLMSRLDDLASGGETIEAKAEVVHDDTATDASAKPTVDPKAQAEAAFTEGADAAEAGKDQSACTYEDEGLRSSWFAGFDSVKKANA